MGDSLLTTNSIYLPEATEFHDFMYNDEDILLIKTQVVDTTKGEILELGCGTGRVLLALARMMIQEAGTPALGRRLTGVELLEDKVERFREAVEDDESLRSFGPPMRIIIGDFLDLDALVHQDTFGAIILCRSAILHLEAGERRTVLGAVRDRLGREGLFFLNYNLSFWDSFDWEEKGLAAPLGNEWKLLRKNVFDRETGVATRFFRFVNTRTGATREYRSTVHPMRDAELKDNLKAFGLRVKNEDTAFQISGARDLVIDRVR
jgi:SAM-dependent methyltransferase